ncbi:serpin family protein [Spiractinospora alimapuensis]|uniref:serpin family protein n=1 Tax=Spiractinospora alimapuensis TaxID=2820884 RepID=UPI001F317370|nr:serpin family protein [Spiractinospora alimapuensis]QVQ52395.1 serpin family protein [Spiractinospora alimapuensis]
MRKPDATPHPEHVEFATRLGAAIDPGGQRDLVWSPYSVAAALTLITVGAGGTTRAELESLLGHDVAAHLSALDDAVQDGAELTTNTGLWVSADAPLVPDFATRMRRRPDTGVHNADFREDPAGAIRTINADVSATTRGLIPRLLASGDVTPDTLAVLVNALWVRMRWAVPFRQAKTRTRPFHSPTGTHGVAMMHRQGRLGHARTGHWQMVTLPGQDDLAMDVILPREASLSTRPLTTRDLEELARARRATEVRLALPRFDLTWKARLTSALDACGVRSAFGPTADLSGISTTPLRLDQVIHEAKLTVDEEGAVGAAATAAVATLAAAVGSPVEFTADRPFHFVLRRRGAILFLGTVTDPKDPAA